MEFVMKKPVSSETTVTIDNHRFSNRERLVVTTREYLGCKPFVFCGDITKVVEFIRDLKKKDWEKEGYRNVRISLLPVILRDEEQREDYFISGETLETEEEYKVRIRSIDCYLTWFDELGEPEKDKFLDYLARTRQVINP